MTKLLWHPFKPVWRMSVFDDSSSFFLLVWMVVFMSGMLVMERNFDRFVLIMYLEYSRMIDLGYYSGYGYLCASSRFEYYLYCDR